MRRKMKQVKADNCWRQSTKESVHLPHTYSLTDADCASELRRGRLALILDGEDGVDINGDRIGWPLGKLFFLDGV